jgi:hypothetical protein
VKSLVFQKDVKQKESVFALVCKTLKCTQFLLSSNHSHCFDFSAYLPAPCTVKSVLEQLVASAKIFDEQRQVQSSARL